MRVDTGLVSDWCTHSQVEVIELSSLEDGTPVLRVCCLDCGEMNTGPLRVEYAPHPVRIGDRWYPVVVNRTGLAVCAACGRLLSPRLVSPVVLFVRNEDTDEVVGEVDFCRQCGETVLQSGEGEHTLGPDRCILAVSDDLTIEVTDGPVLVLRSRWMQRDAPDSGVVVVGPEEIRPLVAALTETAGMLAAQAIGDVRVRNR